MRRVAFSTCLIALLSQTDLAVAQKHQAAFTFALDPSYSSNAPAAPISQSDYFVRPRAIGSLSGPILPNFDYLVLGGVRNDRFNDLRALNADLAFYSGVVSTTIAGNTVSVSGQHTLVLDNFFNAQRASVGDFSIGLTRPIPWFETNEGPWSITPGISVTRRISDVFSLERYEFTPSLGVKGKILTGNFSAGVAVAYRDFDLLGREDVNVVVTASWSKAVTSNITLGFRAKYENNSSNTLGRAFDVIEVGPTMLISFATK